MLARSLDLIMRQRVDLYCGGSFDDEDAAAPPVAEVVQGAVVIVVAAEIDLKNEFRRYKYLVQCQLQ